MIATEMTLKFQLLGKSAQSQTDPNIIKTIANRVTDQDVVIFITLNGNTPELVHAAQVLAKMTSRISRSRPINKLLSFPSLMKFYSDIRVTFHTFKNLKCVRVSHCRLWRAFYWTVMSSEQKNKYKKATANTMFAMAFF